jgi:hypothetical protein
MGKCFPELEPGGLKPAVRTGVVQSLSQQARRYGSGEQPTEGRVSQRPKPLPRSDVDRVTASATWQRPLGGDRSLAATLAWGLNSGLELVPEGAFRSHTNAGLLETSLTLHDRHTLFGRAEAVQKPAHDLHAHEYATAIFTVGKLQAGYVRELTVAGSFRAGVGGTFALSLVPPELVSRYGGRAVPGYGIFVSLRPPRHRM